MITKINNREYAWADVRVLLFGRTISGITEITYKSKIAKEARFGAGRHAKSIQHGRREHDGTITIMQSELIALNRAAREQGYNDLLDVDMNIIVSYASVTGVITIDKIVCASITELPSGMKEGDLQSEHALPFVCLDIEHDAKGV